MVPLPSHEGRAHGGCPNGLLTAVSQSSLVAAGYAEPLFDILVGAPVESLALARRAGAAQSLFFLASPDFQYPRGARSCGNSSEAPGLPPPMHLSCGSSNPSITH